VWCSVVLIGTMVAPYWVIRQMRIPVTEIKTSDLRSGGRHLFT
jgi:cytosine/uracil/thiamine/allantoin permease